MEQKFLQSEEIAREQASFMTKLYGWMAMALCLTAATSYMVASSEAMLSLIFGNQLVFWSLIIGELGLVWYLSRSITKLTVNTATLMFLLYSIMTGLTISFIFLTYTQASIASTFLITAATFGAMSFYGYTTKRDLTSFGNILTMALIGLIIASLVNIFFKNPILYWITTYAGVLIFTGLTAYDTQKIKEMNILGNEGTDEDQKEAIMGALILYLDFINLFLYLLRILGSRRD